MTHTFPEYEYHIPKERIALTPAEPRDSARLFVYDTVSSLVTFDTFFNLADHVPAGALVILNDTRVVPARLTLKKETGGRVGVLLLLNEWSGSGTIPALLDTKVSLGAVLSLENGARFTVCAQKEGLFFLEADRDASSLHALLQQVGETPLPPYIKDSPLGEIDARVKYQSIFARTGTSVAAPTASLHITERVLSRLAEKHIDIEFVTLHVGLGTFSPVTEEQLSSGTLHREPLTIPSKTVRSIREGKRHGRHIVALGTTVVRTLESCAEELLSEGVEDISKDATLFIRPPFTFRVVDSLVTNFHVPRSSLMSLVDAFLEHKHASRRIVSLYEEAVREQFRFFSFGDAMYIR